MRRCCIPGCMVLNVLLLILCASMWPCLCRNLTSFCRDDERDALLKFRQSLSDPYGLLSAWTGKDCCGWEGIRCDAATGRVTRLELLPRIQRYSGLEQHFQAARLSSDLLNLKHLNHLDFSGLRLDEKSTIPEFIGSMKQIRYLNLSNVGLYGTVPSNLGNLSNLEVLDLQNYQSSYYSGDPVSYGLFMRDAQWISHLVALKHLDLSGVHLPEARNLFQSLTMLPSLAHLALSFCGLYDVHLSHSRLFNSSFPSNLRHLDLSANGFQSQTPTREFQNLTSLNYLDISSNSLEGELPEQFGNLKDLKYLSLSGNSFIIGPIPDSWGKLHSLVTLDLSRNLLDGDIPQCLGQLRSLQSLDLSHNSFNGTVTESLGQLRDLQLLDISGNSLEGTISEVHFADCSKLKSLNLGNNRLTIKIKSDWVPPFQLYEIRMASCKLETGFPKWLRSQVYAYELFLSNASISGEIPEWFRNRTFITLDLSHNQLTGPLPDFSSTFMGLDLSHNQFSGQIPANFGENSHWLSSLLLSDNLITGPVPESLCKLDLLLELDLSGNKLSGNIPNCWKNSTTYKFKINLSSNNLSGVIPSSFGNLSSLSALHLSNNNLSGHLPMSLRFLTELVVLNLGENSLSGYIPSWFGDYLQSLKVLKLRNNQFKGTIPPELCSLSQLKWMDLALNQLSGTIPTCFRNLWGMTRASDAYLDDPSTIAESPTVVDDAPVSGIVKGNELEYTTENIQSVPAMDLSGNNLVGSIPEELAYLIGLRLLNLSHNLLQGNIPGKVGNMKVLESLDVSGNNLSGKIPSSISNLTFLARLDLPDNNFGGRIPRSNQLDTLYADDPFMYAGNPRLCGDPLPIRCPGDKVPEPPEDPSEEEHGSGPHSSEKTIFYGVVAVGFATGFWGLFGILIFKKSWRVAYFRFVDEAADRAYVVVVVKVAKLKRRMRSG